jgi:hypothetical protein
MSSDYISLNELIKRDLNPISSAGKYQIQAGENCTNAKIVRLEREVSDICVFEYDIDEFKCSLIQYSLSDEDIENKRLKMIGFLIKNNKGIVIGSLDLIFDLIFDLSFNIEKEIYINKPLDGKFIIILTNYRCEKKKIKIMDTYVGNGNIVHLLMELLGECLGEIVEEN